MKIDANEFFLMKPQFTTKQTQSKNFKAVQNQEIGFDCNILMKARTDMNLMKPYRYEKMTAV